jgi:uncharacterized protein (TIGR02646 family)
MHKLHRGEAPSCLDRHKRTSGNDWNKVSREDKTEIWKALNAMQFDRCAYCESKIIDSKQHIEHFSPRGGFPKLTFTWSNILGLVTIMIIAANTKTMGRMVNVMCPLT